MKLFYKDPVSFDKNCSLLWGKFSSLSRKTQNILFQYFTFLIEEHRTFSSLLVCQNNW